MSAEENMIHNARQYAITKAAADKFRAAIQSAPSRSAAELLALSGMRAQLRDLDEQLRLYEQMRSGKKKFTGSIADMGTLLIGARIARKWTQEQLGEKLGVTKQQINQLESNFYQTAGLPRVNEVMRVLGVQSEVMLKLIDLPDLAELAAPAALAKKGKG